MPHCLIKLKSLLFESEQLPLPGLEDNKPMPNILLYDEAKKMFKYFHLSERALSSTTFDFTPRIPRNTYMDLGGNTIEDDFTKRICLAPSIKMAFKALGASGGDLMGFYVYAGDLKKDPSDDISTIDVSKIEGPSYTNFKTNKQQSYGTNFIFHYYIEDRETKVGEKIRSLVGRYPQHPSDLQDPYKEEFKYAVPDAKQTHEHWSLTPITLIYLGETAGGESIKLSDFAKKYLRDKNLI
jgi:hypothetical protein